MSFFLFIRKKYGSLIKAVQVQFHQLAKIKTAYSGVTPHLLLLGVIDVQFLNIRCIKHFIRNT